MCRELSKLRVERQLGGVNGSRGGEASRKKAKCAPFEAKKGAATPGALEVCHAPDRIIVE